MAMARFAQCLRVMTNPKHSRHGRDFSSKVRRSLTKQGVRIIGGVYIPGPHGGETGYRLDDNGCGRIRSYSEVRAMGGDPVGY